MNCNLKRGKGDDGVSERPVNWLILPSSLSGFSESSDRRCGDSTLVQMNVPWMKDVGNGEAWRF